MLDADKESIGSSRGAKNLNRAALRQSISTGTALHPDAILDRHRLRVDDGERISTGTYFNGFAASYWRRWTVVEEVTLDITVSGPGATVTVYRSMANGRSQRVDSATTTEKGANHFEFDLSLTPFVDGGWYWFDVVAGDADVVIEQRQLGRRRTRGPGGARQRHRRHHHDEPPRLLRQAGRPDRRRRGRQGAARRGAGDGAGHQEGRRQRVLPRGARSPSRASSASSSRATSAAPAASPGPSSRPSRPTARSTSSSSTTTSSPSPRASCAPSPSATSPAVRRSSAATCSACSASRGCTATARSSTATGSGGCRRSTRRDRLGLRCPQPAQLALAAPPRRRRLQPVVHVPDPDGGRARDRAEPAAVHQVGRLGVRRARAGRRLPDRHHARCRGLARAVDRQERRPRLAGLLPPAQPVRRGAAALAVPARRPDDPGELQPPGQAPARDAVLHRRAAPPRARGRAGRPRPPARRPADQARRGPRAAQAVHRRPARAGPQRVPARTPRQAAHEGHGLRDPGPGLPVPLRGQGLGAPVPRHPAAVARVPRVGGAGDGRALVPAGDPRLRGREHARRHLRGALPARPRAVPRPAPPHHRDPRAALPGVATPLAALPRPARRGHLAAALGEDLRRVDRRSPDGHRRQASEQQAASTSAGAGRTPRAVRGGWRRTRPTRCRWSRRPVPARRASSRPS